MTRLLIIVCSFVLFAALVDGKMRPPRVFGGSGKIKPPKKPIKKPHPTARPTRPGSILTTKRPATPAHHQLPIDNPIIPAQQPGSVQAGVPCQLSRLGNCRSETANAGFVSSHISADCKCYAVNPNGEQVEIKTGIFSLTGAIPSVLATAAEILVNGQRPGHVGQPGVYPGQQGVYPGQQGGPYGNQGDYPDYQGGSYGQQGGNPDYQGGYLKQQVDYPEHQTDPSEPHADYPFEHPTDDTEHQVTGDDQFNKQLDYQSQQLAYLQKELAYIHELYDDNLYNIY